MSNEERRQKVKDLMRLALDDSTPDKEAEAAAFKALMLIEKYKLLDQSPLDGVLDGFKGSSNETVKAAASIFQRIMDPDMVHDFKTVASNVKRRRHRR